ncbi:MAG TPA: FecR family protein [Pyrinomonadaceae bacterium]|nr:FecR family protein [Pyrinomonadaceae bacterium]
MRNARIALVPALIVAGLLMYSPLTNAQTRDRFVISARAGGVNAVTGGTSIRARGGSEWQQLSIKEDLESGDVVKTGSDGRVEILLNPGSYLRVGENSEFELADSSLDNLEVRLTRGTAIVEATGADDTPMLINISTPHARIAIVRRGLYRLNVVPGDNTEVIVRKGRAMHEPSHTKIKGGNKVVFSAETFTVAKLTDADKKKFDMLDTWSKERAETVAQANRRVRYRDVDLIMNSFHDRWGNSFTGRSGGFWFYNPRFSCYTFLPFYQGWGSPYGSTYTNYYYYPYYGNGYCCGGRQPSNNGSPGSYNPSPGGAVSNNPSPARPGGAYPSPSGPSSPSFPSGADRPTPPAALGRVERHQDRGVPNQP